MQCHRCGTDNPDTAKFCRNCGAGLALACAHCGQPIAADDRFCAHCGHPTGFGAVDARRATPTTPIEKIQAGDIASDRKIVTTLFADVVGSTTLAEQMDAEDWAAIMNAAFERLFPPIRRYEGTIARLLGDAILAFFGAPVAHEDDPFRAVMAALELIDEATRYAELVRRQHGITFAIRAGINTGPVVVGNVGSDLKSEYTAMGDSVNLAARLQGAARPMTVLVSDTTYRHIAHAFESVDLGEIEVKGKAQPVHIYEIVRPRAEIARPRGIDGLASAFVGRGEELATLRTLNNAVSAGLGRAAVIVAEPGMGKSRLVAEWLATGPRWALGQCLSYGQALAYHLVLSLLRSLLMLPPGASEMATHDALRELTARLFGPYDREVYPYLGHLLQVPLAEDAAEILRQTDPQSLSARYADAFRRLLLALSEAQPLVVVCEDIHWSDPSSAELLVRLLPLVRETRILFCFTTRPERTVPGWRIVTAARDALGGIMTELALRRLSDADSQALVSNLIDVHLLSDEVQALILRKAEGVPFFVEEIIRMLIDSGVIVQQAGEWVCASSLDDYDVPDNLSGLLLTRIDQQPEDARRLLRIASVIGRQFSLRLLETVLEGTHREQLTAWLSGLEAARLIELAQIEPQVEYAFCHALVQDAAYASILKRDRKRLHLVVGRGLEALYPDRLGELAPSLGYHFMSAGAQAEAQTYYRMAAENAARRNANAEALGFYDRALQMAGPTDRPRLLRARAGIHELIGSFDAARRDYEAALDAARGGADQTGEWQALVDLGALWAERDYVHTGDYYKQAYALARQIEDPRLLAATLNRLGNWYVNLEDVAEGIRYHEQALALLQDEDDPDGILESIDLLAMGEMLGMRLDASQRHYQQSAEMARALGKQRLLSTALAQRAVLTGFSNMAVSFPTPSKAESMALARTAREIAASIGWRSGEAYALILHGMTLSRFGEYSRAFESLRMGLDIAAEIDHPQWRVGGLAYLGTIYFELGAPEKAKAPLEEALGLATAIGSVYWERLITAGLALLLVHQNELDEAERRLADCLTPELRLDSLGRRLAGMATVELALARHDPRQALAMLDRLLADTAALDQRGEQAVLTLAYGRGKALTLLLAQGEGEADTAARAEASLLAARGLALGHEVPTLLWPVLAALGRLYRVTGRTSEAETAFGEARAVVAQIAANISEATLRDTLLAAVEREINREA